jgi:hypothetical protein
MEKLQMILKKKNNNRGIFKAMKLKRKMKEARMF